MKHILNNLSEQEKNAIREQHTGGMKVVTENFHKLLGSKLGDSKPLVAEQNKFEFDPKDLEMPDLRDMFLSKNSTPEIEKMGEESKKAMHACVTENNLYKVKGFLDGIETKKMNLFNTIMANLFDRTMGGKSLGQEFNEFSDCMSKKMSGKLSTLLPNKGISEQVLPGLSSGNSQQSVKQVFDSCRNIPSAPTNNTNQLVDMVYRAIQGLGTDEAAIMKAFGSMGTITNFCAVNNGYRKTYGTDLYTDLDGDIDQEMEWAGISRALRNLKQVQTQGKTQKTGPGGGVKPTTGGAPITRIGLSGQNVANQRPSPRPTGGTQKTNSQTVGNPAKPTGGAPITQQGNPGQTFQQRRPSPRPTR